MSIEPKMSDNIRSAIGSALADVWTTEVCRVEKYDAATGTVDVLPMVRRAIEDTDGDTQHENLPVLPNVPVVFPTSGTFTMTFPIVKGDFVLVVFSSSATGSWREAGSLSDPVDLRRHDLSNGFAIPGVLPNKGTPRPTASDAAVIEVTAPVTHLQIGAAASAFVALSTLVETRMTEIVTAVTTATIAVGANGAADVGVKLTASGWSGGGLVPPSTAATKLKSE